MPAKEQTLQTLKQQIQKKTLGQCYLLYGNDSYRMQQFLKKMIAITVPKNDWMPFHCETFTANQITPEKWRDFADGVPMCAERKVMVLSGIDPYRPPATLKGEMDALLHALPAEVCLIFYLENVKDWKPDKRQSIHKWMDKHAMMVQIPHLEGHDLKDWVFYEMRKRGKELSPATCDYFLFRCGNDMQNLISELDKVCAFATVQEITPYHIERVCVRVLDAGIFDLTDAITVKQMPKAFFILQDLWAQGHEGVQMVSALLRLFQRMYFAKLAEQGKVSQAQLLECLGSKSSYYAQKMMQVVKPYTLAHIRHMMILAGETDTALKSTTLDAKGQMEWLLLQLAQSVVQKGVSSR